MDDQSKLDSKYFITEDTYNCPFCNCRHVSYHNQGCYEFDGLIKRVATYGLLNEYGGR